MEISITDEIEKFKNHLKIQNNTRIFFSGIFGIGKTYFLDKFSQDNENYECIFLRPINYSIANNEDIINYIKYDIIYELLDESRNIEFEKTNISKYLSSQFYIKDNFTKTASTLLKMTGKIGKPVLNVIDGLQELNKNIEEHNKTVQVDQKKELTDFLKIIKETDGSIYEQNSITELIFYLVNSIKNEDEKETVLIIDDLDRIDPEHIFRILNVFACHFDLNTETENKFGFDKIIVVGDSENIRNIFHAKYGINVDFNGYIDKFFSSEIYNFHNKRAVKDFIYQYTSELKVGERLYLKNGNGDIRGLINNILIDLIENDLLNVRTLISSHKKHHHLEYTSFIVGRSHQRLTSYEINIILLFDLLKSIYGSVSAVYTALDKLANRMPNKIMDGLWILGPLIGLLDAKQHQGKEGDYVYKNLQLDIKIDYSTNEKSRAFNVNIEKPIYSIVNADKEILNIPFSGLLYLTFQEYLRLDRLF